MGADGAVGAAVVEALRFDPHKRVDAILGIARRLPTDPQPNVEWKATDLSAGGLEPHLRGVDALVNVARPRTTAPTGQGAADGASLARVVLETAAAAGVHHVVQLCSFLAYSPPASPGPVDETWPTDGLDAGSAAGRAVALERYLDEFASSHEVVRFVRIRSGAVLGPRVRHQVLVRAGLMAGAAALVPRLPVVPAVGGSVPVVHHDDLAAAVRSAVTEPAFGAYNVALDAPLRAADVAAALGARPIEVPDRLARRGAGVVDAVVQRLPHASGRPLTEWLDVMGTELRMDTRRARDILAWIPRHPLAQSLRSTLGAG